MNNLIPYKHNHFSNSFKKYCYSYNKEEHYLYVTSENQQPIFYETPFFRVYRNLHQHMDKWYIVLEISDEDIEDDVSNDLYNFKSMLDRVYGYSHEFVRRNFSSIFPKAQGKIDKYTLDTCIIRPFAGQNGQFIKILINNEDLARKVSELEYEQMVKCIFSYNGLLKMKGGKLMEEYVLYDIKTMEEEKVNEFRRDLKGTKLDVEIIKDEEIKEIKYDFVNENKKEIQNHEEMMDNIEVQSIIEEPNNIILEENHKDVENNEKVENQEEVENHEEVENLEEIENKNLNVNNKNIILEINNINGKENEEKNKIELLKEDINIIEENKEDKKREKKDKKDKKNKEQKIKKKLSSMKKSHKSYKKEELSDSEKEDNLSDNEEFSKLDNENKKLFRKLMKNRK